MQSPITLNDIEQIVLDFIRKKFLELEDYVEGLYEKERQADEKYEMARDKFKEFTRKHLNELQEIMITSRNYFCSPLNDLACESDHLRQYREIDDKYIYYCKGQVVITYDDFEQGTGINKDSIKKYLEILEDKKKICRERGRGGFLYRIISKT
jgi:hypothetical protein